MLENRGDSDTTGFERLATQADVDFVKEQVTLANTYLEQVASLLPQVSDTPEEASLRYAQLRTVATLLSNATAQLFLVESALHRLEKAVKEARS